MDMFPRHPRKFSDCLSCCLPPQASLPKLCVCGQHSNCYHNHWILVCITDIDSVSCGMLLGD